MRSLIDTVRFFKVVAPVSRMMTATFLVIVAVDAVLLAGHVISGTSAVRPLLLLQAFAASSGFAVPARRGYYDLLLTRGHNRATVALVHWVMASAPGGLAWVVIGVCAWLADAGDGRVILAPGTGGAMFVVSAMSWALTAPLPRFAGAIGWLVVLAIASTLPWPTDVQESLATDPWWTWTVNAARGVVYPPGLVGASWVEAWSGTVLPAMAIATVSVASAVRWIGRADFRLDAGQ